MTRIEELEALIKENIDAYSKGKTKISNTEFDLLVEELEIGFTNISLENTIFP